MMSIEDEGGQGREVSQYRLMRVVKLCMLFVAMVAAGTLDAQCSR